MTAGGPEEVGVIGSELSEHTWFKSSYSGNTTECLEMAAGGGQVLIRDSKQRRHAVLAFRHASWCGFLAGLVDPDSRGA
ncbi:DUF397 domain-containing protein [Streptomyces sp. AC602_WCS936]|uniref:DUF397 domain-containing protein n=1 Tax=Streptomyces sp. AC602_WCS936 TaxID=2823685 RepID=UPI0027E4537D|nr:DUF397 domain-containing protein [Streptomyces sp. AC602_WCS936]